LDTLQKKGNTMEEALEFKFETNLCDLSCVQAIAPNLDKVIGSNRWQVNLDSAEKVLTVHVADPGQLILAEEVVEMAGFNCRLMK
jgi:hypothetical protein